MAKEKEQEEKKSLRERLLEIGATPEQIRMAEMNEAIMGGVPGSGEGFSVYLQESHRGELTPEERSMFEAELQDYEGRRKLLEDDYARQLGRWYEQTTGAKQINYDEGLNTPLDVNPDGAHRYISGPGGRAIATDPVRTWPAPDRPKLPDYPKRPVPGTESNAMSLNRRKSRPPSGGGDKAPDITWVAIPKPEGGYINESGGGYERKRPFDYSEYLYGVDSSATKDDEGKTGVYERNTPGALFSKMFQENYAGADSQQKAKWKRGSYPVVTFLNDGKTKQVDTTTDQSGIVGAFGQSLERTLQAARNDGKESALWNTVVLSLSKENPQVVPTPFAGWYGFTPDFADLPENPYVARATASRNNFGPFQIEMVTNAEGGKEPVLVVSQEWKTFLANLSELAYDYLDANDNVWNEFKKSHTSIAASGKDKRYDVQGTREDQAKQILADAMAHTFATDMFFSAMSGQMNTAVEALAKKLHTKNTSTNVQAIEAKIKEAIDYMERVSFDMSFDELGSYNP